MVNEKNKLDYYLWKCCVIETTSYFFSIMCSPCLQFWTENRNMTSVQCLDLHKMSTSMYEVFNWGHVNESRPKRLSLFAGASEINIDDPPPAIKPTRNTANTRYGETFAFVTISTRTITNPRIFHFDAVNISALKITHYFRIWSRLYAAWFFLCSFALTWFRFGSISSASFFYTMDYYFFPSRRCDLRHLFDECPRSFLFFFWKFLKIFRFPIECL